MNELSIKLDERETDSTERHDEFASDIQRQERYDECKEYILLLCFVHNQQSALLFDTKMNTILMQKEKFCKTMLNLTTTKRHAEEKALEGNREREETHEEVKVIESDCVVGRYDDEWHVDQVKEI